MVSAFVGASAAFADAVVSAMTVTAFVQNHFKIILLGTVRSAFLVPKRSIFDTVLPITELESDGRDVVE